VASDEIELPEIRASESSVVCRESWIEDTNILWIMRDGLDAVVVILLLIPIGLAVGKKTGRMVKSYTNSGLMQVRHPSAIGAPGQVREIARGQKLTLRRIWIVDGCAEFRSFLPQSRMRIAVIRTYRPMFSYKLVQ